MADNLYLDTMAYTGEVPWHKKGTAFAEEFTIAQAIEAARLGYLVTKEPVYRLLGGEPIMVDDRFVTINNDNQKVLGFVGKSYETLQNAEALAFFDEVMSETGARLTTAGALGNGERVWALAQLPASFEPLLGDRVDQYCLLSTSHDGSTAVTVRFTPIRVVCQNTLTAAMKESRETVSIKHTASVKGRLNQTALIIKEMNAHFTALGQTFSDFASFRINDEWLMEYENMLFGDQPKEDAHGATKNLWKRKLDGFETRLATGMGVDLAGVRGTAWGAYNAAVEWADYEFPIAKSADRTEGVLWGRANEFKQKAFDGALALVRR